MRLLGDYWAWCRWQKRPSRRLNGNRPVPLLQPLAESLRDDAEYLPQDFNKAIRSANWETKLNHFCLGSHPFATRNGSTRAAAVLLQDITRFRLLDEVKSNLVATVSHELKTPLTSIRLALHLLLEETTGPLLPKQLELLVDARDNAERILVMINNLLDLARLEQGPGQLQSGASAAGSAHEIDGRIVPTPSGGTGHRTLTGCAGRPAHGCRRCRSIAACLAESPG